LGNPGNASGMDIDQLTAYYILIIPVGALVMSHIEENIAYIDIQEGSLVNYLIKPYPYLFAKLFLELPYRIIQGCIALVVIGAIRVLLPSQFSMITFNTIGVGVISLVLAFLLTFSFKVASSLLTFWLIEYRGVQQIFEILLIVLAGYTLPLHFFPQPFQSIVTMLPFAGMIYAPIMTLTGGLTGNELYHMFALQVIWIVIFIGIYRVLWYFGLRSYTGVGK
jgi:ABC-2 type transport system permease protein